ncbi:8117_t:CDS:10 [Paraglomus occultum]|uniref:histidine kinase n=1 Tax=Paraglomus occultum TaxID=144539 RepID=A0A9N9BZP0_9GLOM|nr:8117_t:CDS:10 [Paraglomus occultum]
MSKFTTTPDAITAPTNFDDETPVAELVRSFDWASTPLGPIDNWPFWLKSVVHLCLHAVIPITVYIGPERRMIYNQMWRPIFQADHPDVALGKSGLEFYPDAHEQLDPLFKAAFAGKGQFQEEFPAYLNRTGYLEEIFCTFSLSPVFTDDGGIGGVICLLQEITQKVLMTRRLNLLKELANGTRGVKSIQSVCHSFAKILRDNNADIPYAILYIVENHEREPEDKPQRVRLEATTFDQDVQLFKRADGSDEYIYIHGHSSRELPDNLLKTPDLIDLTDSSQDTDSTRAYTDASKPWPIKRAVLNDENVVIRLPDNSIAVLCPVSLIYCGKSVLTAVAIFGINKHRVLDDEYKGFLQLVVGQMSSSFTRSRVREEEQRRKDVLAELDRQKIAFFQNISHELRTPLTLMLSPLDEATELCSENSPILGHLKLVRNSNRRLLNLVDNLLQFTHVEINRLSAYFSDSNIANFTKDLTASFESMARSFGLYFNLDIPSDQALACQMKQKVFLDNEMYEKILFNLCSNAFNYTFTGGVTVRLFVEKKDDREGIVLEVSDTGIGIQEKHLSNIFQRFYRIESQNSRRNEGTGIGLSLVKELVEQHGGEISVESKVGIGTTFRVWFPTGCEHLPEKQVHFCAEHNQLYSEVSPGSTSDSSIDSYLGEHMQVSETNKLSSKRRDRSDLPSTSLKKQDGWLEPRSNLEYVNAENTRTLVLVADDNTDMRNYLSTLIKKQYDCLCAVDGHDALKIVQSSSQLPDLILCDVMMPNMNGYELLTALRNDPKTQMIPVILLSALTGEASVEALEKGADDYIFKPFNARELMARVRVNIKLYHVRRQLIAEQQHNAEFTQMLFTIGNKIRSGFGIQETLETAISEIKKVLSCDSLLITKDLNAEEVNGCKVMAASLHPEIDPQDIVGCTFSCLTDSKKMAVGNEMETCSTILECTIDHCHIHARSDALLYEECDSDSLDVKICTDCASRMLQQNVSIISVPICLKSSPWGWIVAYRQPGSKWTERERAFLRQVSNQTSLAISHGILVEEKLKREAQVQAAKETNKAKSLILTNTSYELRTLLNTISGALTAFERTPLTSEQQDVVNVTSRGANAALSVVNDILDAASLRKRELTLTSRTFDLFEFIEKTIITFGERASAKELELIVLYEPLVLPKHVKTDPERLQQVILNLLSNAIKFTDNGQIVVKLSIKDNLDITVDDGKDRIYVEVSDTGVGVDPTSIERIWESFYQGDASMTRGRDGTGLGLSICKSLIELNGGESGVESELGKGSKFWFTWNIERMPLSTVPMLLDHDTLQAQSDQKCQDSLSAKSTKVLIIDSVEVARSAYATLIAGSVEAVYTYSDCNSALEAAREHKKKYGRPICEFVFFNVGNNNAMQVENAARELKHICGNHLSVVLMVFWSTAGCSLGKNIIERLGDNVAAICKPITRKRMMECISNFDMLMTGPGNENNEEVEKIHLSAYNKCYYHNRPVTSYPDGPAVVRGVKLSSESESKLKSEAVNVGSLPIKRSASSELKDQDNEEERTDTTRRRIAKSSKYILHVEDDAVSREAVKAMLEKLGYKYIKAENGKEAVEFMKARFGKSQCESSSSNVVGSQSLESKTDISLILMNCSMPVMTGFEATRAIRLLGPEFQKIPIVALTASATEGIREKCLEAGMNDYISKPCRLKLLKEKLAEFLGED